MKKCLIVALIVLTLATTGAVWAESALSDLSINPNPVEKQTTITVVFIKPARADIFVEREDGTVVKTLQSGNFEIGRYDFLWNRLGNGGEYVPSGRYSVTVNYETRYTSTKKTLILK